MSPPTRMRPTSSPSETPPPRRLMRVALEVARAGHFVFPLWPRSKKPAVKDWEHAATRDPDGIRDRWAALPWNVGIACGPSGLHVIDLDDAHGHEPPEEWAGARHGRDVLARLAKVAGEPYPSHTYTVQSPTGGLHLYFRAPDEPELRPTVARLGWRIDTRGAGSYIIAAGSARAEGLYVALNRAPIAPLPDWLVTRLTPPPRPDPAEFVPRQDRHTVGELARAAAYVDRVADNIARARSGERRDTLNKAAFTLGRLIAGGDVAEGDARAALHEAAAHHDGIDGWTTAEAEKTITDGLADGGLYPRRLDDQS